MVRKLERRLELSSVVAISIAAMMGSGIFVLPSMAAVESGTSVWLAYLAAALCVLPAAISKAELSTAMPTSGGTYTHVEQTFGPLVGTIVGIGVAVALLLKCAFALDGFGAYLEVFGNIDHKSTALALLAVIVALNVMGVGKVGGILLVLVVTVLVAMSGLFVLGMSHLDPAKLEPFLANGSHGFVVAAALATVSFAGVIKVAAIAEEVKNPDQNLPKGILLSLGIVALIYAGVTYVLVGNIALSDLEGDLRPIHSLALQLGGHGVGIAAAIIAVVTMTSMANAGILTASRYPFAMSRDSLLPSFLGNLHQRFLTPMPSIILCGSFVAALILAFDIYIIAKMASCFIIFVFIIENVTLVVLREARARWYKPSYRSPFYPGLQIFGVISGITFLVQMGWIALWSIGGMTLVGVLSYLSYGRRRVSRKGVIGFRGKRKDLIEELPLTTSAEQVAWAEFKQDASVVVVLFGDERSPEALVELGASIADGDMLEIAHLTEVPEQTQLNDFVIEPASIRSLRRRVNAMAQKQDFGVTFDALVTHDIFRSINDISARLHCQWLVKEWGGKTRGAVTVHKPMWWLRDHIPCNLAIFRDAGVRYFRRILVWCETDTLDAVMMDTADHLARVHQGEMTLVRSLPADVSDEMMQTTLATLVKMSQHQQSPTDTLIVRGKDPLQALIDVTSEYDLLVIGGEPRLPVYRTILGSPHDRVVEQAACSVISLQGANAT